MVNTNEAYVRGMVGEFLALHGLTASMALGTDPKPPTQVPPGDLADNVGKHDESDFNDDETDEEDFDNDSDDDSDDD